MKALLLDVEKIGWQLVKPEASVYEESDEKTVKVDDALVVMFSIEKDDDSTTAESALKDIEKVMSQLKREKLVLYPYAHLSNNLADPKTAMQVIDQIYRSALNDKKITVKKAPFGWNKKWSIEMKGHPLAEQGRNYGKETAKVYTKAKPVSVNTAIVRKSDWAGLPDNDHRTIGERLDLYSFQEVSPGMVYWHNNGFIIYKEIIKFLRERLAEYDYKEINTPILANTALWYVSGHIDHYRSEMFLFNAENEEMGLKPMGCPSVMLIFKSRKWSYKELPFRAAEFDMIHRNEVSGSLTGLFRVRQITQDDSHTFLREDQVEEEISNILKMAKEIYAVFGMKFILNISTMPDSHLGDEKFWEKATNKLRNALKNNNLDYGIKEKDGAFYGPKIDGDVLDSVGRKWQCLTIQVDYQLPQRFGLEYTGEDGKQQMPIVVHKTVIGSLERFMGVLTEHYQGKFPVWLAPVQVRVISISEHSNDYGNKIYSELRKRGIRVHSDFSDRTLEYKIRDAQMQKVPYMIIVGKKEQEKNKITVRDRAGKQVHDMELSEFVKKISEEIAERSFSNEL
jgi:threonyl-tRNA synthetase